MNSIKRIIYYETGPPRMKDHLTERLQIFNPTSE
jgi:hypothetical protein